MFAKLSPRSTATDIELAERNNVVVGRDVSPIPTKYQSTRRRHLVIDILEMATLQVQPDDRRLISPFLIFLD